MVNLEGHPKKLRVSYITFITFTSSGGKGSGRGAFSRHWLCGSNEEQLTCQTEGLARITRKQYKLVVWLTPGMVNAGVSKTLMVKRCRPRGCSQTPYKLNIYNFFMKRVLRPHIFHPFFWYCLFSPAVFLRTIYGEFVAALTAARAARLEIWRRAAAV